VKAVSRTTDICKAKAVKQCTTASGKRASMIDGRIASMILERQLCLFQRRMPNSRAFQF
jgi:hypothetical protein